MKPRRVVIQLEVETDAPLSELRRVAAWPEGFWHSDGFYQYSFLVKQAQANVVRPDKKGKK